MDRETAHARTFGRPRLALDPDSRGALDIRRPGEATPVKIEAAPVLAVTATAQEAFHQTEALFGIWTALERIAAALENPPTTYRTRDPE